MPRRLGSRERLKRHLLKPEEPLLVGRLSLELAGDDRPWLMIHVWCPYCRMQHGHTWDDPPFPADVVTHRAAHCSPDTPLHRNGYHVGLDPQAVEHNEAVVREFQIAQQAWRRRTPEAARSR